MNVGVRVTREFSCVAPDGWVIIEEVYVDLDSGRVLDLDECEALNLDGTHRDG